MTDIHLTRELLWAVVRGELPARMITETVLQHLMTLCPHCREELRAFREEQAKRGDYNRTFELLPALLKEEIPRLKREEDEARRDLSVLLETPHERRAGKIDRARSRFRSATLVRLLLEESRTRVSQRPLEAFELAESARRVTHRNPQLPGVFELTALASAEMANALRATGKLREAEEHFGHVRYLVRNHAVTASEVLARIDELEGSLRRDQRQFRLSEELLSRAALLYRSSGRKVEAASALLNLGTTYFYQGDLSRAIETTEEALRKMSRKSEERLYMTGRFNLARYLIEAGDYRAAEELLEADGEMIRRYPEITGLRLTWLEGKIAAGRGEREVAERAFLEVRDGFIAQGVGYDAAMVVVEDLALLYLREGRVAEVKRLAEESRAIFAAEDVHREAMAALILFHEAAVREELTVKAVRELARFLRDARADPSLRFGGGRGREGQGHKGRTRT